MTQFVYFASFKPGLLKIGTSKRPVERIASMARTPGSGAPEYADLRSGRVLGVIEGGFSREREILNRFKALRLKGSEEWFADTEDLRAELAALEPFDAPATKTTNIPKRYLMVDDSDWNAAKRTAKQKGMLLSAFVVRAIQSAINNPEDFK